MKKKNLLVTLIILISVILISSGVYLAVQFSKPAIRISYINLPQNLTVAFTKIAENSKEGKKENIEILVFDTYPTKPKELKRLLKSDLILSKSGSIPEALEAYLEEFNLDYTSTLPSTIRAMGQINKKQKALPLVLDHFELAWNKKLISPFANPYEAPKSIEEILRIGYLAKENTTTPLYPFVCAGGDDESLINLIGVLIEAFFGEKAWIETTQTAKTIDPKDLLSMPENKAFLATLNILKEWRQTGFLHPEWFHMTKADVENFMESNLALFVSMSFSDHRKISQKAIERYETSYMPASIAMKESRSLTIPSYLIMQIKTKKTNQLANTILKEIYTHEGQNILTNATSLAPTTSQAETSDKQASDVRLWAAASNKALPSLASALYKNPEDISSLAKMIRDYLEQ